MTRSVAALPLRSRVVVRYRLPHPDALTGASLTDVVGTLTHRDESTLVVDSRTGPVEVRVADVVTAKVVPPRPSRRGAPHRALAVDDLQRIMVGAWGALERGSIGEWRLRAAAGFTSRGNSVATLGSPGMPLSEAVDVAQRWYAERGLPLDVTVAGPVGFDLAGDPLGALLASRGARVVSRSLTLTASARSVASDVGGSARRVPATGLGTTSAPEGPNAVPGPDEPGRDGPGPRAPVPGPVVLRGVLTEQWLAAYARYRTGPPDAVRGVLAGSDRLSFAEVVHDGEIVALGRLAVNDGWGGVASMWVDPAHRRRGLARSMMSALAVQALGSGAASLHLQVQLGNQAARNLYASVGFVPHHEYANLVLPT